MLCTRLYFTEGFLAEQPKILSLRKYIYIYFYVISFIYFVSDFKPHPTGRHFYCAILCQILTHPTGRHFYCASTVLTESPVNHS